MADSNSIVFLPARSVSDRFQMAQLSGWSRFCERIRYHIRNRFVNTRKEEGINASDLPNYGIVGNNEAVRPTISGSGKPTRRGEQILWERGVRTRVVLRKEDRLLRRRDKLSPSFNIVYLALRDRSTPRPEDLERLMEYLDRPGNGNIHIECNSGVGRKELVKESIEIAWYGKSAADVIFRADRCGVRWSLPIPIFNIKIKVIFSLNRSQRDFLHQFEERWRESHPDQARSARKVSHEQNILFEKIYRFNLVLRIQRGKEILPDSAAAAAEAA